MIRLSVLQFRAQAATAAAALAVFAVILAATSPHLFGLYDSSGSRPARRTATACRSPPAS